MFDNERVHVLLYPSRPEVCLGDSSLDLILKTRNWEVYRHATLY